MELQIEHLIRKQPAVLLASFQNTYLHRYSTHDTHTHTHTNTHTLPRNQKHELSSRQTGLAYILYILCQGQQKALGKVCVCVCEKSLGGVRERERKWVMPCL